MSSNDEKENAPVNTVCGHPAVLLIKSVESEHQFCELCEMRSERDDAVKMEAHYKAKLAQMTSKEGQPK